MFHVNKFIEINKMKHNSCLIWKIISVINSPYNQEIYPKYVGFLQDRGQQRC